MPDQKTVLTWLEICGENRDCSACCPYGDETGEDEMSTCRENLMADAFALLKEQQEIVRCNDCIYWDKGHTEECGNINSVCFHNGWCKPDWFCADGKRA